MIIRKENQTELITAFVSDKGPFGSVPLNLADCSHGQARGVLIAKCSL
jgi:hypothetical protein